MKKFIIDALNLESQDVYDITGPLDLTILMKFADLSGYDHLRHTPLVPQTPIDLIGCEDIFVYTGS